MENIIKLGIHSQKYLPPIIFNRFTKKNGSRMGKSRKLVDRVNFAKTYKINWKRAAACSDSEDLESCVKKFKNLNAFFQRKLPIEESRPESSKPHDIISPAECFARKVVANREFHIKGVKYTLNELLQTDKVLEHATIYIFRLAPEHIHRIYSPTTSKVVEIKSKGGNYHSVNPIMLHSYPVLQTNYRKIIEFENGLYLVAVGATCIGSVHLSVKVGSNVKHGEDIGTFGFGGSCIVLVIPYKITAEHTKITTDEKHIQPGILISSYS